MGRRADLRAASRGGNIGSTSLAPNPTQSRSLGKIVVALTVATAASYGAFLYWKRIQQQRGRIDHILSPLGDSKKSAPAVNQKDNEEGMMRSCPAGNQHHVSAAILEVVDRIERSEHRDPFPISAIATKDAPLGPLISENRPPVEFPLPTVLVDMDAFRHNVIAMARVALAHGKQIRIGTKSLRVPALIQAAATIIEAEERARIQAHVAHAPPRADATAAATPLTSTPGTMSSTISNFIRVDELDEETTSVDLPTAALGGIHSTRTAVSGLMTYSAAETLFWSKRIAGGRASFPSLLLAYPIADAYSAHLLIDAILANPQHRVSCSVVVDCEQQLLLIADAAIRAIRQERYLSVDGFDGAAAAVEIHVVIDVDMSYRPPMLYRWLPRWMHLGVRRSPLRTAKDVERFVGIIQSINEKCAVELCRDRVGARFVVDGLMGYEAQIAGVPDTPFGYKTTSWYSRAVAAVVRAFKTTSMSELKSRRKECFAELSRLSTNITQDVAGTPSSVSMALMFNSRRNTSPLIVNGGGSGSLSQTCNDTAVTEVTIGSGALCGHLFDRYVTEGSDKVELRPAIFIATGVNRVPEPPLAAAAAARGGTFPAKGVLVVEQMVACHGGGYIASGPVQPDRAPIVVHPAFGVRSLSAEGFGEVQTPFSQQCCCVFAPGQPPSVMAIAPATATLVPPESSTLLASSATFQTTRGTVRIPQAPPQPLTVGDVVLLRPAKSGEIAEHFDEYLLVESLGGSVNLNMSSSASRSTGVGKIDRVPTYRGIGSLAS